MLPRPTANVLGCVVAGALSIAAMMAVTNPLPVVRAGLAIVTPLVAAMAFFGRQHAGSCPRCGARPSRQERRESPPTAEISSRAASDGAGVNVDLGWEVRFAEEVHCSSCQHDYSSRDVVFVPRTTARTAAEAVVLGRETLRR